MILVRRTEGGVEVEARAGDWLARSALSLSGGDAPHVLTVEHKGESTVIEVRQVDDVAREAAA